MDMKSRGSKLTLKNIPIGNDYSMYEKSYLKKSKKILNKLEESRSKSHSRVGGSRNVSPYERTQQPNLVDTKKYVKFSYLNVRST